MLSRKAGILVTLPDAFTLLMSKELNGYSSEEWKRENHSNRIKITLKTGEIHFKASENHSKRVKFIFWKRTDGLLICFELHLCECPQKVISTLFGVIFIRFGIIFTRFESDFHSVRVVLHFHFFRE